jgi:flavin reductase (DIM6/NTAB) family NADH-FMN oxidoreductase RutF
MSVDPFLYRETMAHWASGVTIVTSVHDGVRVGITASSFVSLSLEPPRILVSVAKRLYTHQVITASGIFAVNILKADHLEWGMRFAGMRPEMEDRFSDIDVATAHTGAPILPGVLGWLDCRVRNAYDGGDHTIFVGDVEACSAAGDGTPLLYYHRHWRQLDANPLTLE